MVCAAFSTGMSVYAAPFSPKPRHTINMNERQAMTQTITYKNQTFKVIPVEHMYDTYFYIYNNVDAVRVAVEERLIAGIVQQWVDYPNQAELMNNRFD
jgi:nicotinic acid mononucleotide adenylyltransferase